MLRLILGCSGSGKTGYLRALLKRKARRGCKKLMLIVPEQASFENERSMLRLLGEKDARNVTVLSFSRLAEEVLRRYGGFAGRRLDDGGRSVFMSLALEQVREELTLFRKNADSAELIGLLLSASAEFKMCAVSPEDLSRAAEMLPEGTLRRKTKELSLVLSAYDALVAQSYINPQDDLTRLKRALQEHRFFEDYIVMIDSFQSFTVQEYDVIGLILEQAAEVRVALSTDGLDDPEQGMGLFSLVRRTASNLIRLANLNRAKVLPPAVLKSGRRFHNPELRALEQGVYRPAHIVCHVGDCNAVHLYEAADGYDEAAFVGATIRRLVMQEHYRYRDFAVITRDPLTYRGVLEDALGRRDIPLFMDRPEEIDAQPLMRLLLSAFRTVQSGFSSDDVFSYLKTGLAGLTTEQISLLENYTFLWNLSGAKWREKWTDHPGGFCEKTTERDKELLAEINAARSQTVEPLLRFAERTSDADGEGMAAASFTLLEEIHAAEHLREFAARLSENGEPALAERELRIWDLLMEILNQTALVLGKSAVSRARYAELLRLVILSSRIASIPQGLDEVTVGAANRIRAAEPKVVFLIGAAQGEFPLAPGTDCIISDAERRELIRLGLPLNDTLEGVAVQERFLAYSALSAASEKLYISYAAANPEGKANSASSIVTEARAVLKNLRIERELQLEQDYFADSEATVFDAAAKTWNSNDSYSAALKSLIEGGINARLVPSLERASKKEPARFRDKKTACSLFGTPMQVSATQIETCHLCRFQYFCRYGLDVRERRAAELNALEYGSLMHYLLQRLFQNLGCEKINAMSGQELRSCIAMELDIYVESRLGGLKNRPPRFAYLISRLADSAASVIRHVAEELCQSGFQPVDYELNIGEAVGPLTIPLPDGGEVRVDGKIDRVDLMVRDTVRYIRIVDYKTGHKEFRLSDLIYGMNMQMLVYLAALCENGGKRYGKTTPAGVLYMPANRPSVSASHGVSPEALRAKAEKELRMDGLVLDDAGVVSGMEQAGKGTYIPVTLKNGVPSGKEHLVSAGELERILKRVRGLVASMAEELRSGDISAVPLSGGYNACEWCPYMAVCGHERDDPTRQMQKWDRDAAVAQLTGKGGDDT